MYIFQALFRGSLRQLRASSLILLGKANLSHTNCSHQQKAKQLQPPTKSKTIAAMHRQKGKSITISATDKKHKHSSYS